jgi:hypothetical protein
LEKRGRGDLTHEEMLPIPLANAKRLKMSVAMVGSSSDEKRKELG